MCVLSLSVPAACVCLCFIKICWDSVEQVCQVKYSWRVNTAHRFKSKEFWMFLSIFVCLFCFVCYISERALATSQSTVTLTLKHRAKCCRRRTKWTWTNCVWKCGASDGRIKYSQIYGVMMDQPPHSVSLSLWSVMDLRNKRNLPRALQMLKGKLCFFFFL